MKAVESKAKLGGTAVLEVESVEITDADLLAQFEEAVLPEIRRRMEKRLRGVQAERNETRARRAEMTPIQRRRDVVREIIAEQSLSLLETSMAELTAVMDRG